MSGERTGRRPGKLDTRGQVLAAARQQFALKGYAGATIRAIAAAAAVDPALVHYYYGTKRELFIASLELPFDPARIVAPVLEGDPQDAGQRLVRSYLQLWESEEGRTVLQSLLRSALTDERVMRMMREFMSETAVVPIVNQLQVDKPALRATLLASQIVGLAIMRHIIRLEPLASADANTLIAAVAPNLQHYLTGELSQ